TAILGSVELLLRELAPASPLRQDATEIKKAGERAAVLTRQLLAYSRRQVLNPEVLDLNRVVADMDRMLRRLIGEDVDLVTRRAPLRAVLYDQRGWQGDGARSRDRVRHREAERRLHHGIQRAGPRHDVQDLPAARGGARCRRPRPPGRPGQGDRTRLRDDPRR